MHYLGVAFLACWQGRRESWPTPHTRATFLPEGEKEEGTYYFIFQGRLESFPASRLSLPLGSIPLRLYPERPS